MNMQENTIDSRYHFEGGVINLRVDKVELPGGSVGTREIVEHPGGVCIVPVIGRDVVMVRQYRHPFNEVILEVPAGKLEYGEDHRECGLRELREETGYSAGAFEYMGYIRPTPGFCNEIIHMYLATELTAGEQSPDEDEILLVEKINFDVLLDMIMKNEITDGKTVASVFKALRRLRSDA